MLGLAECFLKKEDKVNVTGYEWYDWNRNGGGMLGEVLESWCIRVGS